MKIDYITSNLQKFEEAKHILPHWDLSQVRIDLPEIQGDRLNITRAKAKDALTLLNRPLIVEDVSLNCNALKGLPGPYVKDFLQKIGANGLAELVHKYSDHRCQVICTAAYAVPGKEILIFEGIVEGIIVKPRGNLNHGQVSFNPCFQALESNKTYGEMSLLEHSKSSMRFIALTKLKHFLEKG